MKNNLLRVILVILLGCTFWTIFGFSSQNGIESGSISRKVARKIIDVFPYTKDLREETKIKMVERSQPIIRKLAHFSIYLLVGILIMTFVSTYPLLLWEKWVISLGVGFVYAISDEWHQSFIPGRTAQVKDVMIDTIGVFTGIIFVLMVISVAKALKRKQNN